MCLLSVQEPAQVGGGGEGGTERQYALFYLHWCYSLSVHNTRQRCGQNSKRKGECRGSLPCTSKSPLA